jgi:uncharacterized protein YprB with RNaseH-like and TPR domain
MMDLKSRLSRLQSQAGAAPAVAAPKPSLATLRERIARLEQRGRGRPVDATRPAPAGGVAVETLAATLEGEVIADGVIRIHKRFALSGQLGRIGLQALRTEPPGLPGDADNSKRRHVYVDTETTGLSGGSGTLAFLVGLAVVTDQAIELTQFLLTKFCAEAASLSAFAACLTSEDRLVSYNGKSYDLPLLTSRFRMQALPQPFADLPHLDLLHPVRRLFGNRWNNCRLLSVEQHLLGFARVDDLPGSEAPAAWFSYVRGGHAGQLVKVVAHNQQDIVSLPVAHTALAQAIAKPADFGVDIHALGRWLAESDADAARALLQSHSGHLCDAAKRFLAQLLRRAGHWPQAVALWETLAANGCTDSLERLAKYHEHISKDLAAARRCCERLPGTAPDQHRRRRINDKLIAADNRNADTRRQPLL